MGFILSVLSTLLVILAGATVALYFFCKRQYRYWADRGIPHAKPSFPFGNLSGVGTSKFIGTILKDLYMEGKNEKYYGAWMLHRPLLMIRDPDLIKAILIRDFSHFHDHDMYANEEEDPLSAHLFSSRGSQWRNLRVKLTPTFTSGKMKMMFPLLTECADELINVLTADQGIIDTKEILSRFTIDIIASAAFGIKSNSLRNPNSIFPRMSKKVFAPTLSVTIRNLVGFLIPDFAEKIKLVVTPKDVTEFFLGTFRSTIDYREENNVKRNDFLQLLMQLKTKGYIEDADFKDSSDDRAKFTFEQAAAQAFIFFIGGFETSATTLNFLLYELAVNYDVQTEARREIQDVLDRHDGKLTYEGVLEMNYVNRCIDETLRKYPPAPLLNRVCTKDYKIPGTDVVIEEGTSIAVSINGLNMDPQYFPVPEKFDPDRFSDEEKSKRPNIYLPFGEGPRNCIGSRFAQMQIRVGIAAILSSFKVEVCKGTPIPISLHPKAFVVSSKETIYLNFSALKTK